ncbi:hypothetical protein AB1Y20_008867 [Prymnesium parvum]|uniref:Fibronectin type-III domain-containing protein n=1 Tax=Prymnesium parvum TaxID=97485 RepID=A0AB34IUL8_PRYPA
MPLPDAPSRAGTAQQRSRPPVTRAPPPVAHERTSSTHERPLSTLPSQKHAAPAPSRALFPGSASTPQLPARKLPSLGVTHPGASISKFAKANCIITCPPHRNDGGKHAMFSSELPALAAVSSPEPSVTVNSRLARMRNKMLMETRHEALAELRASKSTSKAAANTAWEEQRYGDCVRHLNEAIALVPCDVLLRYRSNANLRRGEFNSALDDAGKAVELNSLGPKNFICQAHMLQRQSKLQEAGAAYLSAMNLGQHGQGEETDYSGLLDTVRRERSYFNAVRPSHLKVLGFGLVRSPSRSSIFDPNKIVRDPDEFGGNIPPSPIGQVEDVQFSSCAVTWSPPKRTDDSDWGEPSWYIVQVSRVTLQWIPHDRSFLEGFEKWETVHEGPEDVLAATVKGLLGDTAYAVRFRSTNENGLSEWSEPIRFHTTTDDSKEEQVPVPVPRKWLQLDLHDIARQHMEIKQCDISGFYADLYEAFAPMVRTIRRVFLGVSLQSMVGATQVGEVSKQQFFRFVKDIGLVDTSPKRAVGAKPLSPAEVDFLFLRANMTNLQGRQSILNAQQASTKTLLKNLEHSLENARLDDDEDEDDGGIASMVLHEFVAALVRLAWATFSIPGFGVSERLHLLFNKAIMPRCSSMIHSTDAFVEVWRTPRVQAITRYYKEDLSKIFYAFAASDQALNARLTRESMSLPELFYMLKMGDMFDDNLTSAQLMAIFTRVNATSAENGEDEDAQELSLDEFCEVIARICNQKIPLSNRGGEPFENTWQSFLQVVFVPKLKRLVRKGVAKNMTSRTLSIRGSGS